LNRVVVQVIDRNILSLHPLFVDREVGRLARLGLHGEAIEIAGLLGRFLWRNQGPGRVDRVLDEHRSVAASRVLDDILLRAV
jgi:hypothetical protein